MARLLLRAFRYVDKDRTFSLVLGLPLPSANRKEDEGRKKERKKSAEQFWSLKSFTPQRASAREREQRKVSATGGKSASDQHPVLMKY